MQIVHEGQQIEKVDVLENIGFYLDKHISQPTWHLYAHYILCLILL